MVDVIQDRIKIAKSIRESLKRERRLRKKMRKLITKQVTVAAKAWEATGDLTVVDLAINATEEEVLSVIEAHWKRVGVETGTAVLDKFNAIDGKDSVSIFKTEMDKWIARYSAERVEKILFVTKEKVRKAIQAGQAQLESLPAIANRIVSHVDGINHFNASQRAHTIARTETHNAAMAGQMAAAEAVPFPLYKRWLPAGDERTRDDHLILGNHEPIPKDDAFSLPSGGTIRYPGDPEASADQTINCRCDLEWIPQTPYTEE